MNRTGPRPLGDRTITGLVHAAIDKVSDNPLQQELNVSGRGKQILSDIEHVHPFGFRTFPKSKSDNGAPEVSILSLGGNQSHTIALPAIDRRFGPQGLREGETAFHDAFKQVVHFAEKAITVESPNRLDIRVATDQSRTDPTGGQKTNERPAVNVEKKEATRITAKADGTLATTSKDATTFTGKAVTVTAGEKPDAAGNTELNNQLKGLAARLAQAEKNLHGLFDVTSQLRQIAQVKIPELAALAPILNQDPSGLTTMAGAIDGKAQAYLQQQLQQALQQFLSPKLAGVSSLLSSGVEGLIAGVQSQIAGLVANNPAAAQADNLSQRIQSIADSSLPAPIATAVTATIQGQLDMLAKGNPVVAQVAQLRGALAALTGQAGPGLGFMEPQKRLVQGLTRSMRFAQT